MVKGLGGFAPAYMGVALTALAQGVAPLPGAIALVSLAHPGAIAVEVGHHIHLGAGLPVSANVPDIVAAGAILQPDQIPVGLLAFLLAEAGTARQEECEYEGEGAVFHKRSLSGGYFWVQDSKIASGVRRY